MEITGPWVNDDPIVVENEMVQIPFCHLTPEIVRLLLEYVTEVGNLEAHDGLSEVQRLLEG